MQLWDISDQHLAEQPKADLHSMDHHFQLAMSHKETLREWEEEQEHEEGTHPELARKLAAVRTELLQRQFAQQRGG